MKHIAKCRDIVITTSDKDDTLLIIVNNTPNRLKNENLLSKKSCRGTKNNKSKDTKVLYPTLNTQRK